MSYMRCPECGFVVKSGLEANGGYCPRCLSKKRAAVVMERLPLKLLRGSEAVRLRETR